MAELTTKELLVGILSFCPQEKIPADSKAIYKALEKFSRIHPQLFSKTQFTTIKDLEPFSQTIEDEIDDLMFSGFIGLSGDKFENLIISEDIKDEFDFNKCTEREVELLKEMGKRLPRMLQNNESQRYRMLKSINVRDF